MPQALIAALPLIIGGIGTGVGVGESIYSLANQPGAPKAGPPAPTPSVSQLTSAIAPQALTIESLTGGSLTPDYISTNAPIQAGAANQPNTNAAVQAVLASIFGSGGGGSTATASSGSSAPFTASGFPVNLSGLASTPGFSDFLTKIASSLA